MLRTLLWAGLVTCVVADETADGHVGGHVLLHCSVPPQTLVSMLEWFRPDLGPEGYLLFYREQREYPHYQHPRFSRRVVLHRPGLEDGDLSVELHNLTLSDSGTYSCVVRTSTRQTISSSVLLQVTAASPRTGPPFVESPQRLSGAGPAEVQDSPPDSRAELHEAPQETPGPEASRGHAAAWTGGALFTLTSVALTVVVLKKRLKLTESNSRPTVEL